MNVRRVILESRFNKITEHLIQSAFQYQKKYMNEFAKFLSRSDNFAFINGAPNQTERKRRLEQLKKQFEQQQSNFSSSYDYDNLADIKNGFPELNAVEKVRRITENELARQSAIEHARRKNELLRRNRANKPQFPTDKQSESWRGW